MEFLRAMKEKKDNRMQNLKFKTLDLTCNERYHVGEVRHVVGKKRGYISSQFCNCRTIIDKKIRMTDE